MSTPATITIVLVDDLPVLDMCIQDTSLGQPLAVDLEGVDLCRNGSICLVQLMREGSDTIWVVDVVVLGAEAFDHVDTDGRCLKAVLEDAKIVKVSVDLHLVSKNRNIIADFYRRQLFYDFFPKNIWDLQLEEVCSRASAGDALRLCNGLAKALKKPVRLLPLGWEAAKENGKKLFAPEQGGPYSVFET
ncbi:hypothetical protein P7C73_g444, partial [Tremellales sp. Uapishka_1]